MNETVDVFTQYMERLHESAASGDLETMQQCLKGLQNRNAQNARGWTALMFAARNGQTQTTKALIDYGCDQNLINSNGHTAVDIAKFWNHKNVVEMLSSSGENGQRYSTSGVKSLGTINYFSENHLDRMAHKRKDEAWINAALMDPKSKFLPFIDLQPVVIAKPDPSLDKKQTIFNLLTVKHDVMDCYLEKKPLVIFLGCECSGNKKAVTGIIHGAGSSEAPGSAWFAVNCTGLMDETDIMEKLHPHAELLSVLPGIMQLRAVEAGILAEARSLLAWHDRYQFCPTCGHSTQVAETGWKRQCKQEDCRSRKGVHNTCYPRLDPTVIMVVVSPDGQHILLGRSSRFPRTMWSCLAGFIEPGESIEDACRREVKEEAGVDVGYVEYHSCQPWPMPGSLMIGCLAWATSTQIIVDKEELEDAQWFSRQDAVQMLHHKHPKGLFCPPEQALAHQLIRAWVTTTSNL